MITLLRLAGWKPWETRALPARERKFWAAWHKAIEDQKIMDAVTQPRSEERRVGKECQ